MQYQDTIEKYKAVLITGLIATFLVIGDRHFAISQDKSNLIAKSDCETVQKNFTRRLGEIACNKNELDSLISNDFYNKYLKDIAEFKARNKYVDLYYHSVPDIDTDKCLVVIKCVFKYDTYSYSYKLVDVGDKPKVVFELAALEEYPDGQRRVKSLFLDDMNLRTIRVTEFIGDYNEKSDQYEIIKDSVTLMYNFEGNEFVLTMADSTRIIEK